MKVIANNVKRKKKLLYTSHREKVFYSFKGFQGIKPHASFTSISVVHPLTHPTPELYTLLTCGTGKGGGAVVVRVDGYSLSINLI